MLISDPRPLGPGIRWPNRLPPFPPAQPLPFIYNHRSLTKPVRTDANEARKDGRIRLSREREAPASRAIATARNSSAGVSPPRRGLTYPRQSRGSIGATVHAPQLKHAQQTDSRPHLLALARRLFCARLPHPPACHRPHLCLSCFPHAAAIHITNRYRLQPNLRLPRNP